MIKEKLFRLNEFKIMTLEAEKRKNEVLERLKDLSESIKITKEKYDQS